MDSKSLESFYNLNNNKKIVEPFLDFLSFFVNWEADKILKAAGGIVSMDRMIENNINQSYGRGRISTAVLIRALLVNAEKEMEKRERSK